MSDAAAAAPEAPPPIKGRLVSLDQFRGYTVAGMFFVNFIGGFQAIGPFWKHHNSYCSYADTIMPQFLFAVGFAMQLTFGRRVATQGSFAAYLRVFRRLAGLMLLSIILYELGDGLPSIKYLNGQAEGWSAWKRTWFQTLMHIAVTSLWVLPVIGRPAWMRVAYMVGSAAAHVFISWRFYFAWVNTDPVGIDGGPLGFLTWSIPLLVGTLACDAMVLGRGWGTLGKLTLAAGGLMGAGYLISCPTAIYNVKAESFRQENLDPIAKSDPVIPASWRLDANPPPWWCEPPFVPPPPNHPGSESPPTESLRQWNYWMMSQRAGSLSYLTFSAGFSLAVYVLFAIACDHFGLRVGVFRTLGSNALAGYVLHGFVDGIVSPYGKHDGSLAHALGIFGVFFMITYGLVRLLERKGIYIRM